MELIRVRTHPYGVRFRFLLVVDPKLDEFLGEYSAFE
jgi:hypothetical protein